MKLNKIIPAAMIYIIWSVLIGYFVVYLIDWAVIIAALVAGVYAGFKTKAFEGLFNGFVAGLIGGIILGFISLYISTIAGISLSVSIAGFLTPMISMFSTTLSWFSIPTLAVVGSVFGAAGGLMGSLAQLRKIFLFLTLFTLFLFYAALDNLAWWWGRADWSWTISVVLTHWIDNSVALVFALFITILAHFLKIY
jgi:hypothetical protein